MTNHNTVLDKRDLTKIYDEFTLRQISFSLKSGKITGLIGPNGSGKSTIMKLLLKVISSDGGEALLNGKNILSEDDASYKSGISYVGENLDYYLKSTLKAIKSFYRLYYPSWDEGYYQALILQSGIKDNRKMGELSKGMRVKFALSLALAHRPKLLLMDEPTSGLDPLVRNELLAILKDFAVENDSAILFSSHITEDMSKIANHLIFIYNGKIIDQCDPIALLQRDIDIDQHLEILVKQEKEVVHG